MTELFKSLTGLTFIGVVLEMLMPEGGFKKYIHSIFGIIMLTVLVSGATHIKTELSIEDIFDGFGYEAIDNQLDDKIKNEFILSVEDVIRKRIEAEGIEITGLSIDFDSENKIKRVRINIKSCSENKDSVIKILTEELGIYKDLITVRE